MEYVIVLVGIVGIGGYIAFMQREYRIAKSKGLTK